MRRRSAAAARAAGVEIRTGAEVVADHLARRARRPASSLAGGEEIAAPAVVSPASTPKRVLTRLADPVAIGPSLRWRAGNIRTPGTVAKVNLVARRPAEFPAAGDDATSSAAGS